MEPELWRRVEELCQRAMELDQNRRAEFLERSCGDDKELRSRVESLLAQETRAEHFIESPALEVMGKLIACDPRVREGGEKLIGSTVSHYRVIDKLGGGEMCIRDSGNLAIRYKGFTVGTFRNCRYSKIQCFAAALSASNPFLLRASV